MLKIRDLVYQYPGTEEGIHGVSMDIPREHIFAIVGPSGSGKTTLLQCLGRFLEPQRGRIMLEETDIQQLPEEKFRQLVGIVFQKLYLFPHMSVLENVTLAPIKVLKMNPDAAKKEAMEMLSQFGIDSLANKYPSEISGGQAQRVAICRGLLLKPQFLLLDEPTAALDIKTTHDFGKFLVDLKADTSFIVVTHDIDFVEAVASHGVLIDRGRVATAGEISRLVTTMREAVHERSD